MRRINFVALLVLILLFALLASGQAAAQTVRGTLSDGTRELPLAGASVRLFDASGVRASTQTNTAGEWELPIPAGGGPYRIRAELVGYVTVETQPFTAADVASRRLTLRTRPQVVMLEGITAGEQAVNYEGLQERYRRRQGVVLGPAEVARRLRSTAARTPSRLVTALVPGLEPGLTGPTRNTLYLPPRPGRRGCPAHLVVDGKVYNAIGGDNRPRLPPWELDELVSLNDIRGVEVHADPRFIPSSLRLLNLNVGLAPACGVIVVWTQDGLGLR